jgi:hypothetical protein
MPHPGEHHDPPAGFNSQTLPIKQTGELKLRDLVRIHASDHGPISFGKSGRNRWDDSRLKFGVLYAGSDDFCAFIETFGHTTGVNLVEESDLETKSMSRIPIKKSLRLVDLTGPGLAKIGADNRLCTGNIEVSKKWSRALFEHPAKPDGILYGSRHDPSRQAVAVFERAKPKLGKPALIVDSFTNSSYAAVLAKFLDRYGFGLA